MENTLSNKAKFFSQYWGQKVFYSKLYGSIVRCESYYLHKDNIQIEDYLELKPLSSITDEEVEEVLRLAHNFKSVNSFRTTIKRDKDIIHCWYANDQIGAEYHVCLNFKYATINSNLHFKERDGDESSNHKVNIGEIHFSASRVVGYIQIVDYLRSKGYALPWMGLSVETLQEYGWIKLAE
jgi:DNA polymerase III gamma/tau subunit